MLRHTKFKENPKFSEFAVLQAGHTQWYKDVMGLRPASNDNQRMHHATSYIYSMKPKWVWGIGSYSLRDLV